MNTFGLTHILKKKNRFNFQLDEKYFYLNITSENNIIEIDIDLFTGKLSSIICRKGYEGKLDNGIGIGTLIKEVINRDSSLGYNLDTNWVNRTPFDGLIIYVPQKLQIKCWDNTSKGIELPNFKIEQIELIDLGFAKKFYGDGELIF